jgi:hypothetical protein
LKTSKETKTDNPSTHKKNSWLPTKGYSADIIFYLLQTSREKILPEEILGKKRS